MLVFPYNEKLNFIWSYKSVTGKTAKIERIFRAFIQAT